MGLGVRLIGLTFIALAAEGCGSAESKNVEAFVGHFVYADGEVRGQCEAASSELQGLVQEVSQRLDGLEVELSPSSEHDVLFTSGPRCQIALNVNGAQASAEPGATCDIGFLGSVVSGVFDHFQLDSIEDTLVVSGTGTSTVLAPFDSESEAEAARLLVCDPFVLDLILKRGPP